MRSSSGEHYPGLDHIRALAALMVVVWHFAHNSTGSPVPFNQAPLFGLFDEGHVGVALFMVLSGYLFAKLIGDRPIQYSAFLWNRALRLLPLLALVLLFVGLLDHREEPLSYVAQIAKGAVLPTLPNGGWSITAEAHFYVILPLLLWAASRWRWSPLYILGLSIAVRLALIAAGFDLQYFAYFTIIGRIDQFVLGILFSRLQVSSRWAGVAAVTIALVYAIYDFAGGFYNGPDWPWILLPTIEGAVFGAIIAWYDLNPIRSRWMWLMQKAGEYSYSIYLLHFFTVFTVASLIHTYVMSLNSLYVAIPWALLYFLAMVGVGHLSYILIERPPMRLRKKYLRMPAVAPSQSGKEVINVS